MKILNKLITKIIDIKQLSQQLEASLSAALQIRGSASQNRRASIDSEEFGGWSSGASNGKSNRVMLDLAHNIERKLGELEVNVEIYLIECQLWFSWKKKKKRRRIIKLKHVESSGLYFTLLWSFLPN